MLVYVAKECKSAYGFNNLGQTIIVQVDKQKRPVPYNMCDCSKDKFLRGKDLSLENKQRYGDIYIQRSGTYKEVVLTTPDQLMGFYKSDIKNHKKLDTFGAGAFLVSLLGQCLGFQNGSKWLTMRKVFDSFFTHRAAVQNLPLMIEYISEWCETIKVEQPIEIDPLHFISEVPFTIIAKYLYGDDLATTEFLEALKNLVPGHTQLMHFSFLSVIGRFKIFQYFPFKQVTLLSSFQRKFVKLTIQQVQKAEKLGKDSIVLQLYKRVEDGTFTLENWIQTIDEILFANVDVTGTIMAWALVEMGLNSDEQRILRDEIMKYTSTSYLECSMPKAKAVNDYVKRSDTFLHMCVLEILRLHPLLWFSFPETTSKTILIDGYEILPNTPIVVDQYQINYNSPIWNPPNKHNGYGSEFHPWRFSNISLRDALYSQVTFGAGARKCLGKNFAEILIKTELVHILARFEISTLEEVKFSKDTFVVQPLAKLKLSPLPTSDYISFKV